MIDERSRRIERRRNAKSKKMRATAERVQSDAMKRRQDEGDCMTIKEIRDALDIMEAQGSTEDTRAFVGSDPVISIDYDAVADVCFVETEYTW